MRSFIRHGSVVGAFLGAIIASAGCEQKKATEYVTGVSTQVQVPRDLKAVRITLSTGGIQSFCQSYRVHNGKVLLPRTLGNLPSTEDAISRSGPVTFSIVGLTDDYSPESANPVFADCSSAAQVNANSVRILRRSTQPYVPERILFLPMPLKYSCYDKQCPDNLTCRGGTCVPGELTAEQAALLPPYSEDLGDGRGGDCFNLGLCMGAAVPAVTVNPQDCTFAVAESKDAPVPNPNLIRTACTTDDECNPPGTEEAKRRKCGTTDAGRCDLLPPNSPPWTGVNVEITYDGGHTKEYLDLDPDEGFTIPDPTKPQIFKLAPGLCEMWRGVDAQGVATSHRISSIRAGGTCVPKTATQPICHDDALRLMGANDAGDVTDVGVCKVFKLDTVSAALAVVIDKTQDHASFFEEKPEQRDALDDVATAVQNPAFERTQIGLFFAPGGAVPACGLRPAERPTPPELNLSAARDFVTAKIRENGTSLGASPASIEGELESAYAFLRGLDVSRRAVLVIGKNRLDTSTCGDDKTPSQLAEAQWNTPGETKPVYTYAIQITGDETTSDKSAIVLAGKGAPLVNGLTAYTPIPGTNVQKKFEAFNEVINRLASCVYDVPDGQTITNEDRLNFADPLTGAQSSINFNAACTADGAAGIQGWGFEGGGNDRRVVVCGDDCTKYRQALSFGTGFAATYTQPGLPVPMHVTPKACFTK
ncbi:MAG: hypothetical protein KIT84_06615 [Labilithrix sp.]|nr:hypothetical protein [Labilithrix sp.]MCW5810665.1 hypothetical protein [Labilithrix sp.]